MLELTLSPPVEPSVCDISDKVDSPLLVTTVAVTPILAELIALARPESVLSEEPSVTVFVAPLPTAMEIDPEIVDPLLTAT